MSPWKKLLRGGGKKLLGIPVRLIDYCRRQYWVRCDIPKSSIIMPFTVIDSLSCIGENVFINRYCQISRSSIGNYCSIGSGVHIGEGEHHLHEPSTSAFITGHEARDLTLEDCVIGHDVWIGNGAFVKRGVRIGHGAVIGAHAVVTKDVQDYAIVVGVPAKVVRFRFSKETIQELLNSKWWELDVDEAKVVLNRLKMDD